MSKGSNPFIFRGGSIRSNSVGNVVSIHREDVNDLRVLREELLHNWQYRRGGLLSLTRLALEQAGVWGSDPYTRPGTLEHDAQTRSRLPYNKRPWELRCGGCDKLY